MSMLRPGQHGGMPSSTLAELVERNSDFLTVRRFGRGDGGAGLHNSVSNRYVGGIGGGWLPEYSLMLNRAPALVRGWRNILHDLVRGHHVRPTKPVRRMFGDYETNCALWDGTFNNKPETNHAPAWNYSGLRGQKPSGLNI